MELYGIVSLILGTLTSENEYLYIESLYIDLLLEIAREIDVAFFVIAEFENYDSFPLKDGQNISLEKLPFVAKSILRDKFWCKLVNDSMEIHFGYDYIMYVVINKANVNIKPILNEYRYEYFHKISHHCMAIAGVHLHAIVAKEIKKTSMQKFTAKVPNKLPTR